MSRPKGPVVIELDEGAAEAPTPDLAVPVPDTPQGEAMQRVARLASGRRSRFGRVFWGAVTAFLGLIVSVAIWDFVAALFQRNATLGTFALGLAALIVLFAVVFAMRELAALARLRRVDRIRQAAEEARSGGTLASARAVTDKLQSLYQGKAEAAWGVDAFRGKADNAFDAETLLDLAEMHILAPCDAAARAEVEAAARQVATVTALVPLALADLLAALLANLRMIRRVAEIYGGRGGMLGNWRLTRSVLTHLVATGAMAVGDDMLEPLVGGGLLSKLSRRFGEDLVNGALTARVGVAAMEVCRPLPFSHAQRPPVRQIIKRALAGLFAKA